MHKVYQMAEKLRLSPEFKARAAKYYERREQENLMYIPYSEYFEYEGELFAAHDNEPGAFWKWR